jgi:hypothetical protein
MGQKKPPKRRPDGVVEDGNYIDGMDEFGNNSGMKPGGPGMPGATERGGYGKPTKGDYNIT